MVQSPCKAQKRKNALRINVTLCGEDYNELYSELKARGVVRNLPDFVLRGLELLRQNVLETDLKREQLRAIKRSLGNSHREEGGDA